jgi:hypothetical protein
MLIAVKIWMPALLAALTWLGSDWQDTRDDDVVLEESFDGDLTQGWEWLREQGAHWCVREGALEIRVVPGMGDTVQNALLRAAPERAAGSYAVEVDVTNLSEPTQQYEQAGLVLYQDDKPIFKFVKELVDGQVMMIPGRQAFSGQTVQLRLILKSDSYTAQFRADEQGEFQTAATGELPPPQNERISLQCYHGPPDREHWIRFDNFRIRKLDD